MNSFAPTGILIALLLATGASQGLGQSGGASSQLRDTALALEREGKAAEAEADWKTILETSPQNPEACAQIGFLESQQQHYAEAVRYYRKAVAIDPSTPSLRMDLGLALFKAGELKDAAGVFVPLYHQAVPDSPEAQRLRLLIGLADYGSGAYAASVPYLRDAMARDPQDLPYRLVLAHACLWSKQVRCVLDVYRQILDLNAESAEADMLAGEAYDEMRDHEDAIQQFRNAVKVDPEVPGVHFGLGYLLWCQNSFEEAAQQFRLEADNTPRDGQAIAYWADSEVRLGHAETARPLLERALKVDARQELSWLDLGIIDADAGHNDDALGEFKTAARLNPSDVQVHWRLARLYKSMGMEAQAQREFAKAKSLNKAANEKLVEKLHPQQVEAGGPR